MQRRSFLQLLGTAFPLAFGRAAEGITDDTRDMTLQYPLRDDHNSTADTTLPYSDKVNPRPIPLSNQDRHEVLPPDDRSFCHRIKLTTLKVAGLQYSDLTSHSFITDEMLTLIREPHNPHDSHAVAIRYMGLKVGYIPRTNSRIVAALMDSGHTLYAAVRYFEKEEELGERLWVSIWMVG